MRRLSLTWGGALNQERTRKKVAWAARPSGSSQPPAACLALRGHVLFCSMTLAPAFLTHLLASREQRMAGRSLAVSQSEEAQRCRSLSVIASIQARMSSHSFYLDELLLPSHALSKSVILQPTCGRGNRGTAMHPRSCSHLAGDPGRKAQAHPSTVLSIHSG